MLNILKFIDGFFTIDWNQVTKGWTNEAEQGSNVIWTEHFLVK